MVMNSVCRVSPVYLRVCVDQNVCNGRLKEEVGLRTAF